MCSHHLDIGGLLCCPTWSLEREWERIARVSHLGHARHRLLSVFCRTHATPYVSSFIHNLIYGYHTVWYKNYIHCLNILSLFNVQISIHLTHHSVPATRPEDPKVEIETLWEQPMTFEQTLRAATWHGKLREVGHWRQSQWTLKNAGAAWSRTNLTDSGCKSPDQVPCLFLGAWRTGYKLACIWCHCDINIKSSRSDRSSRYIMAGCPVLGSLSQPLTMFCKEIPFCWDTFPGITSLRCGVNVCREGWMVTGQEGWIVSYWV